MVSPSSGALLWHFLDWVLSLFKDNFSVATRLLKRLLLQGWLLTQHSNCVSITHLGSPHRAEKGRCCSSRIKLKSHSSKGAGRKYHLPKAGQLAKPRGLEVLGYLFTHLVLQLVHEQQNLQPSGGHHMDIFPQAAWQWDSLAVECK